jgi:hypothetical protein
MSEKRVCDLHGAIIDESLETYFSVTDSRTGRKKDICYACARSTNSATAWTATTALDVGDRVEPSAGMGGWVYTVTVAGTTGASEPTWPTTYGDDLVDGSVTYITEYAPRSGAVVYLDISPVSPTWRTLYEWMNGITTESPDGTHSIS